MGLTQKEMAKELDISLSSLARIERNETYPDGEILQKIRKLYKVNLNWLLADEENMFSEYHEEDHCKISHKRIPPQENQLIEKIKTDKHLWFIFLELVNNEIIKSIIYTLLKSKNTDKASLDKYLKILRSALE
ncbi:hypothetical protein BREVNS_2391 [Brevinematales bacterium NS]|nr:hypothetical protein BREVNS_2391 [Brevinematales bacterium NS]